MAIRIIKQGTARAAIVQQFSFSENASAAAQVLEQPEWMDLASIPTTAPGKAPVGTGIDTPNLDLAAVEKAAYENGLLEGGKMAMAAAERNVESVMKRFADSIGEIQKLRSSLHAQAEREVVKLALAVAKKIVHREIMVDRDIVQTLVHVALSHVSEKAAVTICLNPDDYGYMLERRADVCQSEGRDISLVADKSIERGGCLIQTNCGDIDARIEEKFREVEHSFFEGVN
ncbi:MAG: yscL [Acidobacteria bacterium]|nr:yscL [Acidobacteriota bacterium]